jgi:uncharacterized protein YqeY
VSDQILERMQAETRQAMKAKDRPRVGALRMLTSALQQDAKLGEGDAVAVLQRERKKRLEAAEAFEKGERPDQAAAERAEAELIDDYLPEQLSDEELGAVVGEAIAESGASSMKEMGSVMGVVMPKVKGRADGNRVSAIVRERLGA